MNIKLNKKAEKGYIKLSPEIKNKANKKFLLLDIDIHHPQLYTKKMGGSDRWEARIDYHYRFTFVVENNTILILSIGPHDEGLGKR